MSRGRGAGCVLRVSRGTPLPRRWVGGVAASWEVQSSSELARSLVSVLSPARRGWELQWSSARSIVAALGCSSSCIKAFKGCLCELAPAWLLSPDCSDGLAACQAAPASRGLYFCTCSLKVLGDGVSSSWHFKTQGSSPPELGACIRASARPESPLCICTSWKAKHTRSRGRSWPGPEPRWAGT